MIERHEEKHSPGAFYNVYFILIFFFSVPSRRPSVICFLMITTPDQSAVKALLLFNLAYAKALGHFLALIFKSYVR